MSKVTIPSFYYNELEAHPEVVMFEEPYSDKHLSSKNRAYRFDGNISFALSTRVLPQGIQVVYESATNTFYGILPDCNINNAVFFVVYDYDKEIDIRVIVKVGKKEYRVGY